MCLKGLGSRFTGEQQQRDSVQAEVDQEYAESPDVEPLVWHADRGHVLDEQYEPASAPARSPV